MALAFVFKTRAEDDNYRTIGGVNYMNVEGGQLALEKCVASYFSICSYTDCCVACSSYLCAGAWYPDGGSP